MTSVNADKERAQKVLVLCRPYMGDLVLTGPVFRNLRSWMPDARIAAGIYPEHAEMLSFFPEIDEVIPIPRRARRGALEHLRAWARLLAKLRRDRFDLVYDLLHTDRSSVATLATGAPRRLGFIRDRHRLRHRVYNLTTDWAPALHRTHMVDLFLKGLAEIGMPVRTRSIRIRVTEEEAAAAEARLQRALPTRTGPLVLVHPGAGTPNRHWPAERFAAVCDDLQANLGAHVLLLGGPGDVGKLEAIESSMRTPLAPLEAPASLRELAALLQQADQFLGLDSGPAHLAAAVETPAVVLFGAALPEQWGPLGDGNAIVRPSMPCDACVRPDLCRPPNPYHMYCIQRVTPAQVGAALRRQLRAPDAPATAAPPT